MARADLTDKESDFLRKARVVRVATASNDRQPHAVPVCAHWDEGVLFFATGRKTRKVREIQDNPQVSVVADEYDEDWKKLRGVVVEGEAEVVTEREAFDRFKGKLMEKFRQYHGDMEPDPKTDVVVTVWPISVSSWGLD